LTDAQRYPRRKRLGGDDIEALLLSARVLRGAGVAIQTRQNSIGSARLGFIVPRRVLKRAVDRNRVKRLLREWFRRNQQQLGSRDILVRITGNNSGEFLAAVASLLGQSL